MYDEIDFLVEGGTESPFEVREEVFASTTMHARTPRQIEAEVCVCQKQDSDRLTHIKD